LHVNVFDYDRYQQHKTIKSAIDSDTLWKIILKFLRTVTHQRNQSTPLYMCVLTSGLPRCSVVYGHGVTDTSKLKLVTHNDACMHTISHFLLLLNGPHKKSMDSESRWHSMDLRRELEDFVVWWHCWLIISSTCRKDWLTGGGRSITWHKN